MEMEEEASLSADATLVSSTEDGENLGKTETADLEDQTNPVELDNSEELRNPVELGSPEELGNPVELGSPEELGNPVELGSPEELGNPVELGSPEELGNPVELGSPEELSNPVELGSPEELRNPVELGSPEELRNPVELGSPEELRNPVELGSPEELRNPVELGSPEEQTIPEEPRNSDDAEEPIATKVDVLTSVDPKERVGLQSAVGEHLEEEHQERDDVQPAEEDAEDLSGQIPRRDPPTNEMFEEDEAAGTPDSAIQGQEGGAPSVQEKMENPNLQTEYKELQQHLEELQKERNRLTQRNTQLQGQLANYYHQKQGKAPRPEPKTEAEPQQRYQNYLEVIQDLTLKLGKQGTQGKAEKKTRKAKAEMMGEMELDEGQHMVDYEQLKKENQVYREKLEEYKEELLKLKKRNTKTVQDLTHLKEKTHFVQMANQAKRAQLAEVDEEVCQKREVLIRTKQARDGLRADNLSLNERCGLLGNLALLRDFEEKVDRNEDLEKRLDTLKRQYAEFTLKSTGIKNKLQQSRTMED